MKRDPNIVFVTIDSLQPSVLGTYGNIPSPTPFLDDVFADALRLTSCYSVGYPTEPALIGTMSSTLPLDHGGTSYGIRNRPTVLAESLAERGYRTGAFVTGGAIRRLWGYDRGFHAFRPLYPFHENWLNFSGSHIKRAVEHISTGMASEETTTEAYAPFVGEYLEHFERYCVERRNELEAEDNRPWQRSAHIHDFDFEHVLEVIAEQREQYDDDPEAYTQALIRDYPEIDFLSELQPDERVSNEVAVVNYRQLRIGYQFLKTYLHPFSKVEISENRLRRASHFVVDPYTRRWTSGGYAAETAYQWLKDVERPFFAWLHLHDLHKKNLFTWELEGMGLPDEEFSVLDDYLRRIRRSGSAYGDDLTYPLCARYVDLVLERFLGKVKENTGESPLVVLTADHGKSILRERSGHRMNHFYDEVLHVPVAFWHPELSSRTFDGLCSSMDLPATLLDLLEIEIPDSFDGVPIDELPRSGRESIVAEDLGRGLCDPRLKPANICIRTPDKKVVASAPMLDDHDLTIKSAYDLTIDPEERKSVASPRSSGEFEPLIQRARKRADDIRGSLVPAHKIR